MAYKQTLVLLLSAWLVAGQRPSFAGSKPIGFPEVTTTPNPLGNRFGDDQTERLPVEAHGDRAVIELLNTYPIDKQPFWFINWKALEEARKNPQTYPQRENSFSGTFQNNAGNSGQTPQANPSANSNGLTSKFGTNEPSANSFNSNVQNQQNSRPHGRWGY